MRVGIDLDECLAEFIWGFSNYHNDVYKTYFEKENFRSYNIWETIGGSRKEAVKKVREYYETSYFREMPVVFGSFNSVNSLLGKNELFVITSRPSYMIDESKKWLGQHFPDKFSDIIFSDEWNDSYFNFFSILFKKKLNKSDICKKLDLDFMIEDNLDYAVDCAKKGIKTLLLDKPWNKNAKPPKNVLRVSDWNEILESIERVRMEI